MSELKTFGEVKEGDVLQGLTGPVTVVRAYEEHIPETMFSLEFENGVVIEASGNHLWYIETAIDRALHKARIKTARQWLKTLPPSVVDELMSLIELDEERVEISLVDVVELLNAHGDDIKTRVIVRVAESLGPISEEKTTLEDLYDGGEIYVKNLRLYDAKLFAQQILALAGKKWASRWPIVVGQVVTTEYLSRLAVRVDIPEILPHSQT